MREVFVFDVDGTLTEPRLRIDEQFFNYMLNFCKDNDVYLITGSDRQKTFEQLGFELYDACKGVWQCNGNEFWEGSREVKRKTLLWITNLKSFLKTKLTQVDTQSKLVAILKKEPGWLIFQQ